MVRRSIGTMGTVCLAGILGAAAIGRAGAISETVLGDNADGIVDGPQARYTTALNAGATGATNFSTADGAVSFGTIAADETSPSVSGGNFSYAAASGDAYATDGFPYSASATGSAGVNSILSSVLLDIGFSNSNNQIAAAFSGLTAGQTYIARFYFRKWDSTTVRPISLSFNEGNGATSVSTGQFNEDDATSLLGNTVTADTPYTLNYEYVATSDGHGGANPLSVTIQQLTTQSSGFIVYGVSNELAPPQGAPEPAAMLFATISAAGLLQIRPRSRSRQR